MCSVVLKIVVFTSVENINGFLVHIIMHKSNIVLRLQICLSGNAFDNLLLTARCVARCMQVRNCGRYQVATQNVSWRTVSRTTNILSVQPINCSHSRGFCPEHCYTIVDFKLPPCYAFVFFRLGESPGSEIYVSTFRNTVLSLQLTQTGRILGFHFLHLPAQCDQIDQQYRSVDCFVFLPCNLLF